MADKLNEPFTRIPNRVIKGKILDIYDKIVVIYLASFDPSFPSIPKISSDLNISEWRVKKSLKKLEEMRVITVDRSKMNNKYYFFWSRSPDSLLTTKRMQHQSTVPDNLLGDEVRCQTTGSTVSDNLQVRCQTTGNKNKNKNKLKRDEKFSSKPKNVDNYSQRSDGK